MDYIEKKLIFHLREDLICSFSKVLNDELILRCVLAFSGVSKIISALKM